MRATKNEEGAEIERLNKEVAALKRRLEKQAEGVISTAERAQLESKCVRCVLYRRMLYSVRTRSRTPHELARHAGLSSAGTRGTLRS